MKYCDNCGNQLEKDSLYCSKCGKKIQTEAPKQVNERPTNKKERLGNASMVIGIISLVLSFFITVLVFPLALVGLILGIVNKAQNGKKISGIILNGIAMLIAVLVLIAFIVFVAVIATDDFGEPHTEYSEITPNEVEEESIIGRWNCKTTTDIMNKSYKLSIVLNTDKRFSIYDNKESKNYVEGNYKLVKDIFESSAKTKRLYAIELTGEKEYVNGNYVGENTNKYEMIVTKVKGNMHAIINNDNSDKNYYCTK